MLAVFVIIKLAMRFIHWVWYKLLFLFEEDKLLVIVQFLEK